MRGRCTARPHGCKADCTGIGKPDQQCSKYTQTGSKIRITAGKEEKNVWIAVEDNGPGIPAECREHVFEMFYSGKNKVSDSRRSLGLGLALCRSIVNAHGGELCFVTALRTAVIFVLRCRSVR